MKRLVLLLASFALVSTYIPVAQADGYGSAGCGLGSMLFNDDQTWWKQVFAATTNGTFGNQTFGITTGTSNCSDSGVVLQEKEKEVFVATNYESLNKDIAQGGGEYLNAFAGLYGCSGDDVHQFSTKAQENYENLGNVDGPEFISIFDGIATESNCG